MDRQDSSGRLSPGRLWFGWISTLTGAVTFVAGVFENELPVFATGSGALAIGLIVLGTGRLPQVSSVGPELEDADPPQDRAKYEHPLGIDHYLSQDGVHKLADAWYEPPETVKPPVVRDLPPEPNLPNLPPVPQLPPSVFRPMGDLPPLAADVRPTRREPTRIERVLQTAPDLEPHVRVAERSVNRRGLSGQRAAVYLVLDHSRSMARLYNEGTIQAFAERALSLSAVLDDDGVVPTVLFDTYARPVQNLRIGYHNGAIWHMDQAAGRRGQTDYVAGMRAVVDHYQAERPSAPALVIFLTDGGPTSKSDAERAICDAARLPIFWQFIGFDNERRRQSDPFEFLRRLDVLAVPQRRVIDNAGFIEAGRHPHALTDDAIYDQLLHEFPRWLAQARHQGIVRR